MRDSGRVELIRLVASLEARKSSSQALGDLATGEILAYAFKRVLADAMGSIRSVPVILRRNVSRALRRLLKLVGI